VDGINELAEQQVDLYGIPGMRRMSTSFQDNARPVDSLGKRGRPLNWALPIHAAMEDKNRALDARGESFYLRLRKSRRFHCRDQHFLRRL
jgi:hypothetical protein